MGQTRADRAGQVYRMDVQTTSCGSRSFGLPTDKEAKDVVRE